MKEQVLYKNFNKRLDDINDVANSAKGAINEYKQAFNEYNINRIKEAAVYCSPKVAVLGKTYIDGLVNKINGG